jgi:hypothetical protein
MGPLHSTGASDLGPGSVVQVRQCGHDSLIPASSLTQGLRLGLYERIADSAYRLRCRECDFKGSGRRIDQVGSCLKWRRRKTCYNPEYVSEGCAAIGLAARRIILRIEAAYL